MHAAFLITWFANLDKSTASCLFSIRLFNIIAVYALVIQIASNDAIADKAIERHDAALHDAPTLRKRDALPFVHPGAPLHTANDLLARQTGILRNYLGGIRQPSFLVACKPLRAVGPIIANRPVGMKKLRDAHRLELPQVGYIGFHRIPYPWTNPKNRGDDEQNMVASEQNAARWLEQRKMSRRMSRCVNHAKFDRANANGIARIDKANPKPFRKKALAAHPCSSADSTPSAAT